MITLPPFIYAIGINVGLGTAGALLINKPQSSGYTFSLGVELRFTPNWSIEGGPLVIVKDNVFGAPKNKSYGAYGLVKYRAFLSDKTALSLGMGPVSPMDHPQLVPDRVQIMTEMGLYVDGTWGGGVYWRHISSGQATGQNQGVDYIVLTINFNMKGD